MRDFKRLKVWARGQSLAVTAYRATGEFPGHELYGFTSQIRRSAASIPANIAEGCGPGGDAEFARYLHIALGSATELESHCMLARELGYLTTAQFNELRQSVDEVQRMLASLIRKLLAGS
ncbi:four helix bundle protein [soil metagenome]